MGERHRGRPECGGKRGKGRGRRHDVYPGAYHGVPDTRDIQGLTFTCLHDTLSIVRRGELTGSLRPFGLPPLAASPFGNHLTGSRQVGEGVNPTQDADGKLPRPKAWRNRGGKGRFPCPASRARTTGAFDPACRWWPRHRRRGESRGRQGTAEQPDRGATGVLRDLQEVETDGYDRLGPE
jgi:hypothetical protein